MKASRPSRPTTRYFASSKNGIPLAGVCVFMKRRCVWDAIVVWTTSIGMSSNSIHGEIVMIGPGALPSGQSRLATMACVHVVPHFGGVHTKMSRGRGSNPAQRRLSKTALR